MADITKTNEKILAWEKNLERLKNGEFGAWKNEGESEKALLRYWQAQAEADYPQASENVRYYEQLLKEKKMTEETQIEGMQPYTQDEELATIISNYFDGYLAEADIDTLTDIIVANGYRNASDVADEIFEKLKVDLKGYIGLNYLDELKKKYTEEGK